MKDKLKNLIGKSKIDKCLTEFNEYAIRNRLSSLSVRIYDLQTQFKINSTGGNTSHLPDNRFNIIVKDLLNLVDSIFEVKGCELINIERILKSYRSSLLKTTIKKGFDSEYIKPNFSIIREQKTNKVHSEFRVSSLQNRVDFFQTLLSGQYTDIGVFGDLGSGKSRLLEVAQEQIIDWSLINLQKNPGKIKIPVLFKIREYNPSEFEDVIKSIILENIDLGEGLDYLQKDVLSEFVLNNFNAIFLLDGFDEITTFTHKGEWANVVFSIRKKFPLSNIVITSRLNPKDLFYLSRLSLKIFIEPFDFQLATEFVRRIMNVDEKGFDENFLKKLAKLRTKIIETPLFLEICVKELFDLINNNSEVSINTVIEYYIEHLFEQIINNPTYSNLINSYPTKSDFIQHAYDLLMSICLSSITGNPSEKKYAFISEFKGVDQDRIVQLLEHELRLLYRTRENKLKLIHNLYEQYFFAKYIEIVCDKDKVLFYDYISDLLFLPEYFEVVSFLFGKLSAEEKIKIINRVFEDKSSYWNIDGKVLWGLAIAENHNLSPNSKMAIRSNIENSFSDVFGSENYVDDILFSKLITSTQIDLSKYCIRVLNNLQLKKFHFDFTSDKIYGLVEELFIGRYQGNNYYGEEIISLIYLSKRESHNLLLQNNFINVFEKQELTNLHFFSTYFLAYGLKNKKVLEAFNNDVKLGLEEVLKRKDVLNKIDNVLFPDIEKDFKKIKSKHFFYPLFYLIKRAFSHFKFRKEFQFEIQLFLKFLILVRQDEPKNLINIAIKLLQSESKTLVSISMVFFTKYFEEKYIWRQFKMGYEVLSSEYRKIPIDWFSRVRIVRYTQFADLLFKDLYKIDKDTDIEILSLLGKFEKYHEEIENYLLNIESVDNINRLLPELVDQGFDPSRVLKKLEGDLKKKGLEYLADLSSLYSISKFHSTKLLERIKSEINNFTELQINDILSYFSSIKVEEEELIAFAIELLHNDDYYFKEYIFRYLNAIDYLGEDLLRYAMQNYRSDSDYRYYMLQHVIKYKESYGEILPELIKNSKIFPSKIDYFWINLDYEYILTLDKNIVSLFEKEIFKEGDRLAIGKRRFIQALSKDSLIKKLNYD